MACYHLPVLLRETIEGLAVKPDGVYVDGTAGGGGHSEAIAKRLSTGRLIAIDQDPDAIAAVTKRLADYPGVTVCRANFSQMEEVVRSLGVDSVDGVLMDIGVSSHQLDTPERGFSYHSDAPLDMRMSQEGPGAGELVNSLPWQELAEILSRYGEERFSKRIAQGIAAAREQAPIETTFQLAEIVKNAYPAAARRDGHPARKTFQALRIAVNGELDRLSEGLDAAFSLLKPGGRLAVITFHSLEDRLTKRCFQRLQNPCVCPPKAPVCTCGRKPKVRILARGAVPPTAEEIARNPRARSAKLRVAEKL